MKSKLVRTMVIIILVITLAGMGLIYYLLTSKGNDKEKKPSVEEIAKQTISIPEITTNIADGNFIRIQYQIEANSEATKLELEKRMYVVQDIIIKEISKLNKEFFEGPDALRLLEKQIQKRVNGELIEGKVVKVYTTSFLLQ